jgi:hypothetical protein
MLALAQLRSPFVRRKIVLRFGRIGGVTSFQPGRKILPEATGIDEVRLHFPVLEQIRFDRDSVHWAALETQ